MNTSLTEVLSSLLFLVVQTTLPAIMPTQKAQWESPSVSAEAASEADATNKARPARKRVSHTPYYDFGRRQTRAKD